MRVPISCYDDYPEYIERISNGERNVLTAYLTEHLSPYEGYKKLPLSRWGVQTFYDYNFCAAFYIAGNEGLITGGMTLNLVDNCIDTLPSGVHVGNLLGRQLTRRDFDMLQKYHVTDCFECGSCTYNCPARMPLTHAFKTAKVMIQVRAAKEKAKAEAAAKEAQK